MISASTRTLRSFLFSSHAKNSHPFLFPPPADILPVRRCTGTKEIRKTGTSCVIAFIAYSDANYRIDNEKRLKTTNTCERAVNFFFSFVFLCTRLEQPRRFVRWKTSDSWSSTITVVRCSFTTRNIGRTLDEERSRRFESLSYDLLT